MRHLVGPATLDPGAFSWLFLAGLLVLLPVAVIAQERQLRRLAAGGVSLSRRDVYVSAVITHVLLLAAAFASARDAGMELFGAYSLAPAHVGIGLAALALGSLTLIDALTPASARQRAVAIAPHTRREALAFAGVAVSAGVAEEIAYRGVLFALLAHVLGGWWIPAIVAAVAFGIVHLFQGWRAAALAAGAGLVAQIVVGLTGTLLIAIAAHIVHDVVAGAVISRRARRSPGGNPVAV